MPDLPLALLAFAAILAIVYWLFFMRAPQGIARSLMKTVPVALLAIAALAGSQPGLLALALTLSAIGDAFLSRQGDRAFMGGLGSFLLAHLAFTALFLPAAMANGSTGGNTMQAALIVGVLVLAVLFRLWPHLGALRLPVIVYALAIGSMAVAAAAGQENRMVLAGVALFVVSDIVLALEKFVPDAGGKYRFLMPSAVWLCYFCGQALILAGFLLSA